MDDYVINYANGPHDVKTTYNSTGGPVNYEYDSTTGDSPTPIRDFMMKPVLNPIRCVKLTEKFCSGDVVLDQNNSHFVLIAIENTIKPIADSPEMKTVQENCSKEELLRNAAAHARMLEAYLKLMSEAHAHDYAKLEKDNTFEQVYKELACLQLDLLAYGIDICDPSIHTRLNNIMADQLRHTAGCFTEKPKTEEDKQNGEA